MEKPVSPEDLVSEAWMDDPVATAEFNKGLAAMDIALQPFQDALDLCTRLTSEDWNLQIT